MTDDVERQMETREAGVEAFYEAICDAGLYIGTSRTQELRETLARDLVMSGMTSEELDLLIGWASVQRCDDWRGLLVSKLRDGDVYGQILSDLKRTGAAMTKRKSTSVEPGLGDRCKLNTLTTADERMFSEWFYDGCSIDSIASRSEHTPTRVLEICVAHAKRYNIPDEWLERRKGRPAWAVADEKRRHECRPE